MLDDTEHVVIDGLELTPKDDSKRVWTYVPLHPTLEHNQSGRPMLQVIEAGATAFLQCTARVALNEDTRATLLARLREKKPQAEAIESALLSVEQITLEAKTDNEWVVIAHSKGSGISPWTAAFAATLAAGPLSAIKAAVAGQKDHARLKALIVLPGSPAALVRTESTTDSHTETASGTASTSFTTQTETTSSAKAATRRELTTDLAECFSQSS